MSFSGERRYSSDARRGEILRILAAGVIALTTSACSLSYSFVSLDIDEPETTASIAVAPPTLAPDLDEEDWRRAKAALAVALDPQGPGTLVSWDNPDTARRGSFTASSQPFVRDDEICRSFSAQVSGPASHALKGTACRPSGGEWTLKEVKTDKLPKKA